MFILDVIFPFGVAIICCLWLLWDLRRENRRAAARQLAVRQSLLPASLSAAHTSSPSHDTMSDVRKQAWDEIPVEELNPLIGRRFISSERMMLAHVYLKQGAVVPAHDHHNEQFTYILSGALRFWIGEHADNPGDTYIDVKAGEVLVIPGMVRHRAEALEDTLDVDVFDPPRQDWLDGSDAYLRTTR